MATRVYKGFDFDNFSFFIYEAFRRNKCIESVAKKIITAKSIKAMSYYKWIHQFGK